MPRLPIRTRLVLLFTLQVILIFGTGAFYLDWQLRRTLENELSGRLESLATAAALQLDTELLLNLSYGDEGSRTYRTLRTQLLTFNERTKVRRTFVFDQEKRSILDSRSTMRIGQNYSFLAISDSAVATLFSGVGTSSVLFSGSDGKLYKTGFSPIWAGSKVVAAMAVEGSAETLDALGEVRQMLMAAGLLVLAGSVVLGLFFSERLTTPINRLKQAAGRIASGDYTAPIKISGTDEIAFLGRTMEEMRKAIILRDTRQKTMLAGVAHEIRNPLGGIELFAGLLIKKLEDDEAGKQARKIQYEVQNLNRIVSDFLDYARPQKARKEAVNCAVVLDEVKMLLAEELEGHQITFQQQDPDCRLHVDPNHLKQIFLNLIKNSLQAMPTPGAITVSARCQTSMCELCFTDSGPGVPPEISEQVFEPFFTSREGGTGLGLAIVRNLVQENGGDINLVVHRSRGSNFLILLPRCS